MRTGLEPASSAPAAFLLLLLCLLHPCRPSNGALGSSEASPSSSTTTSLAERSMAVELEEQKKNSDDKDETDPKAVFLRQVQKIWKELYYGSMMLPIQRIMIPGNNNHQQAQQSFRTGFQFVNQVTRSKRRRQAKARRDDETDSSSVGSTGLVHDMPDVTTVKTAYRNKDAAEIVKEPHKGMVLEIYRQKPPGKTEKPEELAVDDEFTNDDDEDDTLLDTSYVLEEQMELELGAILKHAVVDYAYQPVLNNKIEPVEVNNNPTTSASTTTTTTTATAPSKSSSSSSSSSSSNTHEGFQMEQATWFHNNAWWTWWLPLWRRRRGPHGSGGGIGMGGTNDDFEDDNDRHSRYRMKSAFAGGSHGEVWKGRRKCQVGREYQDCQVPLIFKRMHVGEGYRILEAGLREIYFGSLLANKQEEESGNDDDNTKEDEGLLFTHYVDHFFREAGKNGLELWIVFSDAGRSMRNYLYTGIVVGDLVVYQHSWFWTQVRMSLSNAAPDTTSSSTDTTSVVAVIETNGESTFTGSSSSSRHAKDEDTSDIGKNLMKTVLHQVLEAAAVLHNQGIVHRDIKPSNILCTSSIDPERPRALRVEDIEGTHCVLGDFSSAYDDVVFRTLYTGGPSRNEQTDEYAPPEAIFGQTYENPQHARLSPTFDSWSIGIVALEILLGTPSVFSVDQRTRAVLTHKLQKSGASAAEIDKAMYLAGLSQFCIFNPSQGDWPLRFGDPLFNTSMTKVSCTLNDFQHALRARDPLAIGFESADLLLHLIWQLLTFDPEKRITAAEALRHPYFEDKEVREALSKVVGDTAVDKAVESQMLDPRMDFDLSDTVDEFTCPHCKRVFGDWRSCQQHATARKHAKFCVYDKSSLPTCLNAHSMLPAHSLSGHCDIQGRRRVMEDFHAIHLLAAEQFYAILDGHNGNFASKFVASCLYEELAARVPPIEEYGADIPRWKEVVQDSVENAFTEAHDKLLAAASLAPHEPMRQSGTTATLALVTNTSVIIASVGDSRAVLSSWQTDSNGEVLLSPMQLTKDHVASDEEERKLVEMRGGSIEIVNSLARVNGSLAITRSIGDASLAHFLSREPHTVPIPKDELREMCGSVDGAIPCFLIIASDGMWDAMTNQEAVDMVAEVVSNSLQDTGSDWRETAVLQHAAEALTLEAYARGSTDNIGVYVVALPMASLT